jgi:hypothetical protein
MQHLLQASLLPASGHPSSSNNWHQIAATVTVAVAVVAVIILMSIHHCLLSLAPAAASSGCIDIFAKN